MMFWYLVSSFITAWLVVGSIFLRITWPDRPRYKNPCYTLLQTAGWYKLLRMQARDLREVKRLQAELLEKK